MVSEHIVIADELYDHSVEPTRINREEAIVNRVKGIVTELAFFDEGCLKIRQRFKNRNATEHLIDLCYLDPKPGVSKRSATGLLWASLVLGLAAVISAFVLPETALSGYTLSATAAFATLATLSLMLQTYRRELRYQFRTATGRVVVLTLSGSFGCVRRTRAAARMVHDAILSARKQRGIQESEFLRAEMKAHYKLAETGVISREACSEGTRLILSRFNQ